EDILRDGRKSFENGLPTSDLVKDVDTTIWGRVPSQQALVDAFNNDPTSRQFQDVGYDGLRDGDERTFFDSSYLAKVSNRFGPTSNAYQMALTDPSSDDYHYFRGTDYDNDPLYSSILNRYKKFNGPDGNSPTTENQPESYNTMGSSMPNVEDINRDNTLSESERYYQYVVHLTPDKMKAGENYITNVYKASDIPLANGTRGTVKWYQFKIPIRTPDKVVGNIQDFTSIRFLRMFFKNFQRPVVCRFATLELSRGEWRKYAYDLLQPGEYIPDGNENQTTFDISTVNIEENGSKQPVPYVMPPGIERETNWGTTNQQKLNEQSMVLKICNLVDGDARAAYKTTEFDFRQFKRLQMFVHAERTIKSQSMKKGDLTVFVRLGSDFTQNYYEYEIPLTFTEWGTSATDVYGIWPETNDFDINFDELVKVKQNRNVAMRGTGSTVGLGIPYVEYVGDNRITVMGSPTISDVKSIMIGVRNPKKSANNVSDDDGQDKCAEVWVDELRLTDFNNYGGWAGTARIAADLADLGRVQLTGSYSSDGFGTLEQKQTQRQLESILGLGFDSDFELGKFFPEKSGIRIPVHFDYSITQMTPRYDPLNPDVLLKEELKTFSNKQEKDSVRSLREDYTQRKNFNLMNVRKDRMGNAKPKVYDIENFNVSYAYSEIFHRSEDVAYDLKKKYTGGLGYNFTTLPKAVTPFSRNRSITKHKGLRLISDFNFYYLPKSFSFRTDMNREYDERQFRNKSLAIIPMQTFYIKRWDWSRIYDLKYDFARSLRFTLSANVNSFIHEPPGKVDHEASQQIWDQIFSFGTATNYNQQFTAAYDIPFSKVGFLDWISLLAGYRGDYHWTASPVSIQARFGNTIENSQGFTLNGTLTFTKLYDKVPYLKKINQKNDNLRRQPPAGKNQKPDKNQQAKIDSLDLKPTFNLGKYLLDGTLRILMGVRKATFNYVQGNGTTLPGFMPKPGILGNDWGKSAPGLGFIFGVQEPNFQYTAANEGWLSEDSLLNTAYWKKFNENLTINVTIEPINDLR
ncbi:MAG: cell surface protein SprA, partial [Syntrophothermus sp.]